MVISHQWLCFVAKCCALVENGHKKDTVGCASQEFSVHSAVRAMGIIR